MTEPNSKLHLRNRNRLVLLLLLGFVTLIFVITLVRLKTG
jgi:hypothetical protein